MHDCVVIGAGPAGLATSAALTERGIAHAVLERGRVGESWRRQRWDSLRLNTPGWANAPLLGDLPRESYLSRDAVVQRLAGLAAGCPVQEGVRVTRLAPHSDGSLLLQGSDGDRRSRAVVVATGEENVPRTPALAGALPEWIGQLHSADYRNPGQLPPGAVLVVGSAQSGCQIAEELIGAGRRVYLATTPVGRAPAQYRGRPSVEWLHAAGFFHQRPQDLPDPAMMRMRQPILAPGARSLSLQLLSRAGVTLAGRLVAVDGERLRFDDSAAANIAAGDVFAARMRGLIDEIIARSGADAPPAEPDEADVPVEFDPPTALDLPAAGITAVVWCTGLGGDFSWLSPDLLDDSGRPRRTGVAAPAPGLWYVGLRWLTHRGSAQLPGMPRDAAAVADAVTAHLSRSSGRGIAGREQGPRHGRHVGLGGVPPIGRAWTGR